jgi:hypothetical protein
MRQGASEEARDGAGQLGLCNLKIAEQSTKCVHDFARSVTWAVGKVLNSRNST